MSDILIDAFDFCSGSYTSLDSLVNAMGIHWMEGRQALFGGRLRQHLAKAQPAFANACAAAEREYRDKAGEGNRIYFRWLCSYPGIRSLYWRGKDLGGPDRLADALDAGDGDVRKLILYLMQEQLLHSVIVSLGAPDDTAHRVRYLEQAYNRRNTFFVRDNVVPMLVLILRGDRTFTFDGRDFLAPADLAAHLQTYADRSPRALSRAAAPLFADEHNLDPLFEAWLLMNGFVHELDLWSGRYRYDPSAADGGPEQFVFDEDREPLVQAVQQTPEEFARASDGVEDLFVRMLTDYPEGLDDPQLFRGLISDHFPALRLQGFLLLTLYRMDIVRAIRDAPDLDLPLAGRFEKRLTADYGVGEALAKWAVGIWFRGYGERVLKKGTAPSGSPV